MIETPVSLAVPKRALLNLRAILVFTLGLSLWGAYGFSQAPFESGLVWRSTKWLLAITLAWGVGLASLGALIVSLTGLRNRLFKGLHTLVRGLARLRLVNLGLAVMGVLGYAWLIFGPYGVHLNSLVTRLWLLWLLSLANCLLLKAWGLPIERFQAVRWGVWLFAALLLTTAAYQAASFTPDVSPYPFTLSWSETSRYYYASLFFAESIYGPPAPPPTVLHPSRYLLQAIPFLLPAGFLGPVATLWLHRFWQVLLWIGLTALSALALTRRLQHSPAGRPLTGFYPLGSEPLLVATWFYLFLFMGPVYYHLEVPLILVLWGFRPGVGETPHSWRARLQSIVVLLAASLWAGISRVNWFPVPGLLAAALYLLETPVSSAPGGQAWTSRLLTWARYAMPAVGWFASGTAAAFGAQALYIQWSGNAVEHFTTSLSSALLWYRLWPNPTYPPGILPAFLLVTAPVFLFIGARLLLESHGQRGWQRYHPIRFVGLGGILLGLFAGGLVVSVKIGGGSNLHNLDACLALLLVIGAYFFFDRLRPEMLTDSARGAGQAKNGQPPRGPVENERTGRWSAVLVSVGAALSVLVFAFFAVAGRGPDERRPSAAEISKALTQVKKEAEAAALKGGEVLFISNRHLLTFGFIEDVPLAGDYERVFLMEMAMAGDPDYLGRFHADLRNHRFALIVSEPLFQQKKGGSSMFGEENDAWVRQVSDYILCAYRSEKLLRPVRIELFVPDPRNWPCP